MKPKLAVSYTHYSLSVVRITFFLVAAADFFQLYLNRYVSYPSEAMWVAEYILPLSIFVMILLAFGWQSRITAIVNYLLIKLVQYAVIDHYHFDYAVENLAFIFIFAPTAKVLSVDSMLRKRSESEDLSVPVWFSILLFLGIELVYFDSLFYKYNSKLWMDGLAFWMPAALPHFSTNMFPDWLEFKPLVMGLAYLSLVLETLFPLILLKFFRPWVFIVGFGLHAGIALFFPIPFFGLGMCALYLYFIPWERLLEASTQKRIEAAKVIGPRSFTRFGYAICILMTLSQALLIYYRVPAAQQISPISKLAEINHKRVAHWMGLYHHGVYDDVHFTLKPPILRYTTVIDGEEIEIPSYSDEGYPDYPEVTGRYWVYLNFLLRYSIVDKNRIGIAKFERVQRYLKGWFMQKGIPFQPVTVYYKDVSTALAFDFSSDDNIEKKKWHKAGVVRFDEDGKMLASWRHEFRKYKRNAAAG